MPINGIKIYDQFGHIKKEISPQEALKIYDERNKSAWSLTPNERRLWNRYVEGVTLADQEVKKESYPTSQKRKQYPSERDIHYKEMEAKYSITCKGCGAEVKMKTNRAKYCSTECRIGSKRTTGKRW